MKNPDRKIRWSITNGLLFIEEKTAYVPHGYSNRKWDTNCVAMSLTELERAIEDMRKAPIASGAARARRKAGK